MLITRIITACILFPVVLLLIYKLPPFYFSGIVALLILWCSWEWSGFIGFSGYFFRILYVIGSVFILLFANFIHPLWILIIALMMWIWIGLGILFYQQHQSFTGFQTQWMRVVSGLIVLTACWTAIVTIRSVFGSHGLVLALLIIFSADSGAYFFGRWLGKHQLISAVSPKKTWEGLIGGILCSLAIAAIGISFFYLSLRQYVMMLVLSFLTAFFSVIGDLGVSLMKRIAGLKDSGRGLPGHGGILDRMDSVASGTTLFALGILLLQL